MAGVIQHGQTGQPPSPPSRDPNQWQGLHLQESDMWLSLPIVPSLINSTSDDMHKALEDLFRYAIDDSNNNSKTGGGWIHVNQLSFDDVQRLRQLGSTIMARKTICRGKLQVRDNNKRVVVVTKDGLQHCFWDKDLVSHRAIRNFGFEPNLWGWVLREFQTLELQEEIQQQQEGDATTKPPCHLAFLDIGVNVGDWASPLRLAFPTTTPYFGIEGSPATAAIATANLRTSIEHHQRQSNTTVYIAPTALLPFSLLSKPMIGKVQTAGHVCFADVSWNLGGQGINAPDTSSPSPCKPSLMAGGTLLPHALQALIPLQLESSCPGRLDWPRIYIAKLDIEGFEFKTLVSALDWLMERPPCYLMIEFHPQPQIGAIIELLLDVVGYDSLWRSHSAYGGNASMAHDEFPTTSRPFWSNAQNRSEISLHEAVQADLKTIAPGYKDYIFGFENRKECLRRLME